MYLLWCSLIPEFFRYLPTLFLNKSVHSTFQCIYSFQLVTLFLIPNEQALVPGINTLLEDLFCTGMSGDVSKVSPTEAAAENDERKDTYCTMTNRENQIDISTEMFVCPI